MFNDDVYRYLNGTDNTNNPYIFINKLYETLLLTKEHNDCYNKRNCLFCFKKCEFREVVKLFDKLESWQK